MVTKPAFGPSCDRELFDVARFAPALPARGLRRSPSAMEQIGRGDGEQAEARDVVAQFLPRGERFGHDRTHGDNRGFGAGARLAKPVAALEGAIAPAVVIALDLSDVAG